MSPSPQEEHVLNGLRTAYKAVLRAYRTYTKEGDKQLADPVVFAFLVLMEEMLKQERSMVEMYWTVNQPSLFQEEPPQSEDGGGS